jgi:hypothetical protein
VLRRFSALLLLLPACLVSFNDYPVGELGSGGAEATAGQPPITDEAGAPMEASGGVASPSAGSGLIDDFETEDDVIAEEDGRKGAWYVTNDGRGMQTPRAGTMLLPVATEPAREGSGHAVRTSGGPFYGWGALIGATLASGGYDLSRYQGIRLWVRSAAAAPMGPPGALAATKVRLSFPTLATNVGGGCTVCNDHFGADVPLSAEWTQVDVPFSSLKQSGFGRPQIALDLTKTTDLQLSFPASVTFDLWLDDVELY